MNKQVQINVDVRHLTRIEGHGNIRIRVEGGKITEARWDVVETPRFIEVMLQGKHYTSAPLLAARICGICSISHALASLRATEQAFGLTLPPKARLVRQLAKHGETLQSHILHLCFLAVPDFLEIPSALPLLEKDPDLAQRAIRLKGLANRFCDLVAGRTTHPVSLCVGGISALPANEQLLRFKDEMERSVEDLWALVYLFHTIDLPEFTRETEFVSLKGDQEYPFIGGDLVSSDGVTRPEAEYLPMTNEYVTTNNTSKWTKLSREAYAVGALARFNNNSTLLHPQAQKVAHHFNLEPVCHNPFANNLAQLIECLHVVYESCELIDALVAEEEKDIAVPVTFREGEGVGAVEAPRGILFHHYHYDDRGRVTRANCVVPSTQNNANIHLDLYDLVEKFARPGLSDEEMERLCSMLVRAYDPCLSCAVH